MTRPTGSGDPGLDRIPAALVRRGVQFVVAHIVRSKQAADRPKDRRVMALLVSQLEERDNRELVVPLDYENSVNQPYQDYVRRECMATEDPQECARGEGVSYP